MSAGDNIGSSSTSSQIAAAATGNHVPVVTPRAYRFHPASLRRCPGCGEFFKVFRGQNDCKKYCSHRCVQRAWRARHPKPKIVKDRSYGFYLGQCPGCGKDVWGTNKQQKYCTGSKCRMAALRKRRAAGVGQSSPERSLPIA